MLFCITNKKSIKVKNFYTLIQNIIKANVNAIILREKELATEELLEIAMKIKKLTEGTNTSLIVNSNIEVANKVNADGYHVSFKDFVEGEAKYKGLLGVSVHSIKEAVIVDEKGADYILVSHIFETKCKEGLKPKGLKFIEEIKKRVRIPIIALGGINTTNIESVIKSGADGVAVMSYIMTSMEPYNATKSLKDKLPQKNKF